MNKKGSEILKKLLIIILSATLLLLGMISFIWYSSYNGEIILSNQIDNNQADIHAAMEARYTKVSAFIDAIQGANATVTGYLDIIKDARVAFADALSSNNLNALDEAANLIDSTFVTLLSYMEDNPSSYNTVSLYGGFMGEFAASTNTVINEIRAFNKSVKDYNNHIQKFPNNLFLSSKQKKTSYQIPNYNTELPTFN